MTAKTHTTSRDERPGWLVWREKEANYKSEIARLETLLAFAQSETARLEAAHNALSRQVQHSLAIERARAA